MGGGAWPFLVGGVNCLFNSDNERDLNLLNTKNGLYSYDPFFFLKGLFMFFTTNRWKFEAITGL